MRALLFLTALLLAVAAASPRGGLLSRHRRYLTFPEGSTFNLALCMSNKAQFLGDSSIYTEGVAWGCSYDLPNNTAALASAGAGVEPLGPVGLRRKDRTELYRRVERAVDSAGLDGHECMLRAICEAETVLGPRTHLIMEMFRIALAIPLERYSSLREPQGHVEYMTARHNGVHGADCGAVYRGCPVSLLQLATSLVPAAL